MENPGRLIGQIAADANKTRGYDDSRPRVTERRVKVVLYLTGLAQQGRTIQHYASLLRVDVLTIKRLARDHLIDFSDYRPFARQRDKGEAVTPRIALALAA